MYVCLCNGHRSQDIERTARERNLTCAKAIYDALGGPVCCGTCLDVAQDLVNDVHTSHPTSCQPPCGLRQPIAANTDEQPTRRLFAAE